MSFIGRDILSAAALLGSIGLAANAQAASITLADGMSPAGEYLSLSAFGISPTAGAAGNGFVTTSTQPVVFAGQSWSQVAMGEDGLLVFGNTSAIGSTAINQSLPSGSATTILAPFWTDLDLNAGGAMRIGTLSSGSRSWLVFDWANMALVGGGTASFQVWMGLGVDEVTFAYGDVTIPTQLTIGAQDASGTVGTNYAFNGAGSLPGKNTQLRVTTSGLPVTAAVPEPAQWALLILGFGLIGAVQRGRRKVRVRYA
ncbi:PEPxxWA-CTERM sorting domain-containing protein [Sphingomonas flavalba]|uniref:PEPxxWA-CTERM sorting domain-containing protein n=1 Tax=Sphingomonas flavalba TaxID=2559804 RepID=UPI0039DFCD72